MSKIGLECKAYFDAAGVGGGTWALLDEVIDVSKSTTKNMAKKKTRASKWELHRAGQRNQEIEIVYLYEPANAGYMALEAAFLNDTRVGLALMDALIATVGTKGWQGDYEISEMSDPEPLEEFMAVTFKAVPSAATGGQTPTKVTIAA